jgi:hypothetical protein
MARRVPPLGGPRGCALFVIGVVVVLGGFAAGIYGMV